MENKINLVEILKDCPKGMELYSPLCGDCTLYDINNYTIRIEIPNKDTLISLHHDGRYCSNGEIMLFPKGKTTWEGFQRPFKDGDIVTSKDSGLLVACIYKRKNTESFNYHIALYKGGFGVLVNGEIVLKDDKFRFATEEEKEKLFKAIKDNGYKWNAETKTLEKLNVPIFKVGDKIKLKSGDVFGTITQIADCYYTIKCKNNTYCWPIKKQDDWELINKPKFKVGDKIKGLDIANPIEITAVTPKMYTFRDGSFQYVEIIDKNYVLVPNKFDINTLVPFESRVLMRDTELDKWSPGIWGYYDKSYSYPYKLIGTISKQCIPYEGNEHLLSTTNDCNEFYKTWE